MKFNITSSVDLNNLDSFDKQGENLAALFRDGLSWAQEKLWDAYDNRAHIKRITDPGDPERIKQEATVRHCEHDVEAWKRIIASLKIKKEVTDDSMGGTMRYR